MRLNGRSRIEHLIGKPRFLSYHPASVLAKHSLVPESIDQAHASADIWLFAAQDWSSRPLLLMEIKTIILESASLCGQSDDTLLSEYPDLRHLIGDLQFFIALGLSHPLLATRSRGTN